LSGTPGFEGIDHVHVFVADRVAAERWYADVLGLTRVPELGFWASGGGPLTLQDASGSIHLALFERPAEPCRSTVALRVSGAGFLAWREHLEHRLPGGVSFQHHEVSVSLYFSDPDGNPYEITSYDKDLVEAL
jgi:catechol-2,3-dioxygenase